jgi:hypothetical protein
MTQTSTQWLYDKLNECYEHYDNGEYSYTYFVNESKKILDQAKEINKQQIIDAFIGYDSDTEDNLEVAEQYYNETYK